MFVPVDLMAKCVGSPLWIIMKDQREFVGRLSGFDEYVNMVLEDTFLLYTNALKISILFYNLYI